MKFPDWPAIKGFRDIKFGLDRVLQLLERLNNPHLKLPPTIHIAGTNGKGSTLAFLHSILEEGGYKIHKYTSPHLVNFNERIIVCGQEITDNFLNECLDRCKELSEQEPKIELTFFEGITVAAFLAFSLKKADILLLETGMGGELDATNVLPQVLCSIITPISLDHQEFLGESITQIAQAKAGIIKPNCPIITYQTDNDALNVIKEKADNFNSSLTIIENNEIEQKNDIWCLKIKEKELVLPYPSLRGDIQLFNASLAINALKSQKKFIINDYLLKEALLKVKWPARLQKIEEGQFFESLKEGYDKMGQEINIFLDSAHNIAGAEILSDFLKKKKQQDYEIYVICAMLKDKDHHGFFREISPHIDHLVVTEISDDLNSLQKGDLQQIAQKYIKNNIILADDIDDSISYLLEIKSNQKILVIICGSLYLAGEFLEKNQ